MGPLPNGLIKWLINGGWSPLRNWDTKPFGGDFEKTIQRSAGVQFSDWRTLQFPVFSSTSEVKQYSYSKVFLGHPDVEFSFA